MAPPLLAIATMLAITVKVNAIPSQRCVCRIELLQFIGSISENSPIHFVHAGRRSCLVKSKPFENHRAGCHEVEHIPLFLVTLDSDYLIDVVFPCVRMSSCFQHRVNFLKVSKAQETKSRRSRRRVATATEINFDDHVSVIPVSNCRDAGIVVTVFEFQLLHFCSQTVDVACVARRPTTRADFLFGQLYGIPASNSTNCPPIIFQP